MSRSAGQDVAGLFLALPLAKADLANQNQDSTPIVEDSNATGGTTR